MKLKTTAPLIAIGLMTVFGTVFLGDWLSFETLRENRSALIEFRDGHYLVSALLFVAAYIAIVTFSIPGAVFLTLLGGFLFGTVLGAALTVTGATIGAVLLFAAARIGVGNAVEKYIDASDERISKVKARIQHDEIPALFIMRLLPIVPFFVANLLPAMIGVKLRNFAFTTFVGIIPGTLVYSSIGAGLGTTFDAGETPKLNVVFEPHILLPLIGLAVLAALPIFFKPNAE